jgi:hypothetical protein
LGISYQTHTHTQLYVHTAFYSCPTYNFCSRQRACCVSLSRLIAYSLQFLSCTRNCYQVFWGCGAPTFNILTRWVGWSVASTTHLMIEGGGNGSAARGKRAQFNAWDLQPIWP